ncbi:WXG100 family type VII secretion target [Nocardia sp. NPDC051052]|uniref:WXG100 family type VII secretion target n=1 Tax=Nocardia sp. NPDC051052 TaxID=3364322 RepID=UPI003798E137
MSWIGGDLGGLQSMGTIMKAAQESTDDIVKALGNQVDKVVGDAGYSGNAADAFRKAWTSTSIQVGGLATVTSGIGQTIATLGDRLQQIEADLYNAAYEAKGQGAQIDDNGKPLILAITGDPDSDSAKNARQAQVDYTDAYNSAITIAQGYRLQAAKDIADAIKPVQPTGKDSDFTWDKRITIADYLRGLYAVPNERNSQWAKDLPDKVKSAQTGLEKARADWNTANDAYHAQNKMMPFDDPARINHIEAFKDLRDLNTNLAAAEANKGELPASKALNVKVGDIDKLLPELSKVAPKGLEFMKNIPVVDVAASGLVAELQAQDDIEKGQSPTKARTQDYGAAAVGLAAGAGTAVGIGAAATFAGFTAPAWGTALAAGFVVVGVGDVAYEGFHEHWSEDIHDRGVWNGTMQGLGSTFANTGHDIGDLASSAKDAATSVWHKIF